MFKQEVLEVLRRYERSYNQLLSCMIRKDEWHWAPMAVKGCQETICPLWQA